MPTAPAPRLAPSLDALVRAARSLWTGIPPDLDLPAARLSAFERSFARELLPDLRLFVPAVGLSNGLFWLSDRWAFAAYPGVAEVVGVSRAVLTGLAVAASLALWRFPAALTAICTIGTWATCFTLATTLSLLGGPSSPWPHFIYPFVLCSVAWYMPPKRRIWVTLGVGAAVVLGTFGARPAHLADPMAGATLGFLFFVLSVSLGIGLGLDCGRIRLYCAQSDLAQERAALTERVAEQTAALRRFALRLDEVQDAERAHVARELHDELGQTLTAARLSLRLATGRYAQQPAAIGANLTQLALLLERLTEQTRSLVRDLRPPVLDDLGLAAAVEWLAGQTTRHGGPPCVVTVPEALALPDAVALTAFRFVQEALTNVARHARASRSTVTVVREAEALVVEVGDDGVGMPEAPGGGIGLIGMRERAGAVGGEVRFFPVAGGGTRVRLRVPLGAA